MMSICMAASWRCLCGPASGRTGTYRRIPARYDPRAEVVAALRAADRRGARMISICTGAFVLAAAGLLDGRRATTHWRHAAELQARHPAVDVDPRVLYVDEGRILTSAGVAAGIDLCLHVVARDHGVAHANAIARRMVVAPHRGGGQAQFVERALPAATGDGLEATRAWVLERLEQPLTVAAMAGHAARSDFGTATTLREHFSRSVRTTPTAYRRAFSASAR
jgi:AraC family transcriptional activator FtrA